MAKYLTEHGSLLYSADQLGDEIERLEELTISGKLPEEAQKEVTAAKILIAKANLRISTACRLLIEADAAEIKLEEDEL